MQLGSYLCIMRHQRAPNKGCRSENQPKPGEWLRGTCGMQMHGNAECRSYCMIGSAESSRRESCVRLIGDLGDLGRVFKGFSTTDRFETRERSARQGSPEGSCGRGAQESRGAAVVTLDGPGTSCARVERSEGPCETVTKCLQGLPVGTAHPPEWAIVQGYNG